MDDRDYSGVGLIDKPDEIASEMLMAGYPYETVALFFATA